MDVLTIGSRAWAACPRQAKDIDAIVTPEALKEFGKSGPHWPIDGRHYVVHPTKGPFKGQILDLEVAWPGSTGAALLELVGDSPLLASKRFTDPAGFVCANASLNVLLTLKLSHRFKASPHFLKTMRDIQQMRQQGAAVPRSLERWLEWRQRETLASHKHPNLNQGRNGFFRPEDVPYVYVHDDIHLAVAVSPGGPAYKEFQADGAEVKVDRAKWEQLPDSRKLDSVLEEAYVLALERHQIPNNFAPDAKRSFLIALEKICTTISSGWWREWAWEHYDQAVGAYNPRYVEAFKLAVREGRVRWAEGKQQQMGA